MQNASTRASDDDRDSVIRQLGAQTATGRLTQAEFEERMEEALRARTWGDLATLVADLPAGTTARPGRRPRLLANWRRLSWVGVAMVGVAVAALSGHVPAVAGVVVVAALCALVCGGRPTGSEGNR